MHHAPAVHFAVGPSRWLARIVWTLWVLGCGAMVAFFTTQALSLPIGLLWGSVLLIGAGTALRSQRGMPCGDLRWDGAAWHWSGFSGASPCHLVLHIDWQQWLVVTLHQQDKRSIWLWLEPRSDRHAWLALRRAVVGARRAAITHGDGDAVGPAQERA
jgi:hypothetical protein